MVRLKYNFLIVPLKKCSSRCMNKENYLYECEVLPLQESFGLLALDTFMNGYGRMACIASG